jgi:2-polyprenyl-6-methoxyphenol hydroxylase-like FAD-dependent oxidoreductase
VPETHDVVVVGGGIAGAGLATVLARAGHDVLVLERQTQYRDKVRGETMQPWGVVDAMALDLHDVMLAAGGGHGERVVVYDEMLDRETAEAATIPLTGLVGDVPGSLNVGHPAACEALINAAADAGATVVRGNGNVSVEPGTAPAVTYATNGTTSHVSTRLVIAADGRQSPIRRALGIELHSTEARTIGSGMLIEGADDWPEGFEAIGTEGDVHYLVFPRPGGVVRLYLWFDIAQQRRFTGPDRQREFLDAFRLGSLPGSDTITNGRPAGPCATYPSTDTWTDTPFVDGVVFIGDAAGWNDPIIGQGLSIAMRDVRIVSDLMLSNDDWSAATFEPYAHERSDRMRRVRLSAQVSTDVRCGFDERGRNRRRAAAEQLFADPLLLAPMLATLAGPESAPAEAYDDDNIARFAALGA